MPVDNPRLTFISYSRADGKFALELASELKQSGFNIWLDQLDIPTGARWDDEIQKALTSCDVFMIILTRHSVASNNVKDEINYALSKEKCIMPVLLESVEIPFRLQRVQYVDFTTKTYPEGIEDAKKQLQKILNQLSPLRNLPQVRPLVSTGPNAPQPVRSTTTRTESQPRQLPKGTTRTVSLLAGLALLSISCLAALWFIWPKLPGLTQQTTGRLATEDSISNTIINPTTPVAQSPVTIPPTSSPVPTATIEPTQTATLTPIPTVTPVIVRDPAQFLIEYFNVVILQKDLAKGFSWLTPDYQREKALGWDTYVKFWGSVETWDYSDVQVEYNNPPRALVRITYTLYYYNTRTAPSRLDGVRYCLLQTSSGESWQIDLRANCP